jgi:hypothetical protein
VPYEALFRRVEGPPFKRDAGHSLPGNHSFAGNSTTCCDQKLAEEVSTQIHLAGSMFLDLSKIKSSGLNSAARSDGDSQGRLRTREAHVLKLGGVGTSRSWSVVNIDQTLHTFRDITHAYLPAG